MAKDEFKGYAARFEKGGQTLRDVSGLSHCPECNELGLYRQVWRKGERPGMTLYAIAGSCPNGHKVERYGHGEIPIEQPTTKIRGL